MINSIYIDVEELVLELDRAAESPKCAQDWAARFRDTLIYGGRKKNPLPFGMYCITLSKGFAANGKLGRWKSIAKGILNKRDNNENPTEEEIVAEIIAQNGREEYEKVLTDIKAAKNAKKLSADGDTREGSQKIQDGSDYRQQCSADNQESMRLPRLLSPQMRCLAGECGMEIGRRSFLLTHPEFFPRPLLQFAEEFLPVVCIYHAVLETARLALTEPYHSFISSPFSVSTFPSFICCNGAA